jgi:hypothetical protein
MAAELPKGVNWATSELLAAMRALEDARRAVMRLEDQLAHARSVYQVAQVTYSKAQVELHGAVEAERRNQGAG